MNERREKSIFQLLPPGVCLLEKFALNNFMFNLNYLFQLFALPHYALALVL